jgi:PAS domain-containing protein/anti-sigma regulatory factor (Ser/Thr protein kinase)
MNRPERGTPATQGRRYVADEEGLVPRWADRRSWGEAARHREVDEALALLDALVEQAPVGLAYLDPQLRYTRVNDALLAMVGGRREQWYGCTPDDLHPAWAPQLTPSLRAVLATGEHQLNVAVHEDDRSWRMTCYPVRSSDGEVLGVGVLVVEVTETERATAQLARAAERLRLLVTAGGSLARTLDEERLLHLIGEFAVPRLADTCAVDMVEGDGLVRRVVLIGDGAAPDDSSAVDPGDARPGHAHGPPHRPPRPVAEVLATGLSQRLDPIPPGLLAQGERSRTALVLPLRGRGVVLGALTVAVGSSGRRYDDADVALVEELAARAAMAVDNARLYARQRDVAVALQHSLLPQRLPELPGIEVAARYVPASADTEVGGDWFDVVPLEGGRVGIVIGDVMGRGVRAAAVMGQLRAAVRAYAVMNLAPARLVGYLDRVVQALDQVQLVTCLYVELDPQTGDVRYANAGHHPPLLRRPDGATELLPGEPDAPLGVGSGSPAERSGRIPFGGTLVVYTDGLVEERGGDVDARVRLLCAALREVDERPERLVDGLLARMGRTRAHHDDVALLAVRLGGVGQQPAPDVLARLALPGDTAVVRAAREFAADTLQRWVLPELTETVTLLVSEVVTNALKHARSGAELRLHRTSTGVEVEVLDADDRLPTPRIVDTDAESGRGLYLVEALASSWGAEPVRQGKRVWFRVDAMDDAPV